MFWVFVLRPPTGSSLPMRYPLRPTSKSATAATAFAAFAPFLISEAAITVFPTKRVRAAVAERVDAGGEVTLIAQDTGRWGEDFPKTPLPRLAYSTDSLLSSPIRGSD